MELSNHLTSANQEQEISEAAHRGKLFALVYLANYTGIAVSHVPVPSIN